MTGKRIVEDNMKERSGRLLTISWAGALSPDLLSRPRGRSTPLEGEAANFDGEAGKTVAGDAETKSSRSRPSEAGLLIGIDAADVAAAAKELPKEPKSAVAATTGLMDANVVAAAAVVVEAKDPNAPKPSSLAVVGAPKEPKSSLAAVVVEANEPKSADADCGPADTGALPKGTKSSLSIMLLAVIGGCERSDGARVAEANSIGWLTFVEAGEAKLMSSSKRSNKAPLFEGVAKNNVK